VWAHNASNVWQKIQTTGGNAIAAGYTEIFDDAYAYLANWVGNDYEVTATVYWPTGLNAGETEILLRVSDTGSTVKAYEILHNTSGGYSIVRWNGALGDYVELLPTVAGLAGNGVQFKVRIVGNTINIWDRPNSGASWTQRVTNFVDSGTSGGILTTGKPGMAFYVHAASGNRTTVGFSEFSVTAL
jgi:hypothetical protein